MSAKEAAVMEVELQTNGFKVHASHTCDGCNVSPIIGKRFKSSDTANYDLCSKCFAAYDGDDLFEETLLARDRKSTKDYVLKIKTNDGPDSTQIRRINVADVWGEDEELSYTKLIALASKFASIPSGDSTKAKVTYIDGDGDRITISSDVEFTDSFRQTIKPCKPFRVSVLFPMGNDVKATPASAVKNPQKLIRIERQIARKSNELEALKAKAKLASAPARPPVARGLQKPIGLMNAEKFDSSFFIHARHTCDGCSKTPIIGTRYRATHIPDFDFCSNCFEKYEGEKTDFKPEALDRDRKMQQRWLRRHLSKSHVGVHSSPPCPGFWRRSENVEAGANAEQNPVEAAIGFLKTLDPAIAQSLKDVDIHVSPPCQGVSEAAKAKSEEKVPEEAAPAEARKPDSKEEESVKTEQKSGTGDSKDDSFFSDADGNSIAEVIGKTLDVCVQAMEDAMQDAMLDDAVQKSSKDVAAAAAVAAADAFSVASSIAEELKNSVELSSVNASSQTDDVAAKEAKDEGLKTEEQSNAEDDWSVVTDENEAAETKKKVEEIVKEEESAKYNMLRQKNILAQEKAMLMQRLAGISNQKKKVEEIVKEEESDKSVTSVEPISAVVLAKWDTELKQLHELGFLDDRINTNALEQLEASHLGCGSDEAVTVNAAVEHMLKN